MNEFGAQEYKDATILISTKEFPVWICMGCGALVRKQEQHNLWHQKTRSVV